jgi:hypothetical protein
MARKDARKGAEGTAEGSTVSKATYWREQIGKASNSYSDFHTGGDRVIDRYRIEKANAQQDSLQDRYNILYSSTETMRPSLYAQTPKVQVTKKHRDRKNPIVAQAVQLLETTVGYAVSEIDFDEVMENVVEDYLLPGLGFAWVRYEPVFKDATDREGNKLQKEGGKPDEYEQVIDAENVHIDYIAWKDALFGPCRTWKELPWAAKKVFMVKSRVKRRFGEAVANALTYVDNATKGGTNRAPVVEDRQAVIWEIWDKENREVVWISDGYDQVLDQKDDPLRLKKFWPFPKPMRAISNTRTFVPRPFYSQYQSQAEELDNITHRIRHLTNALNVRGAFDGSVNALQALLSPKGGNKMIPIENWHQFIGQSGVNGAVVWVPIDQIVKVLMELYKARDAAKAEIYEITGFSDIVRGLSKASETLGAQQIKQDWATGRLRIMQKEVQRFCKDLIVIIAEIAAEHFADETFALYSGFEVPPSPPQPMPQPGQPPMEAAPQQPDPAQDAVMKFKAAVDLLRKERERCANIGIETDSTILPDEENERKARLEFLASIGAFLQQAAPTVQQFPTMAPLLASIMMFSVRSFRAARPIEEEFEKFQDALTQMGGAGMAKPDEGAAKSQAALQVAQVKEQGNTQRQQNDLQHKSVEADKDRQLEIQKLQLENAKLQAQAASDQVQLQIKQVELEIKKAELALKQGQAQEQSIDAQHDRALASQDQAHRHDMERTGAAQGAYEFEAGGAREDAARQEDGQRQDRQFVADQNNQQESSPGG